MRKGSRLTPIQRRKATAALRIGTAKRWNQTPEERFWSKVDRRGPGECWPWTASVDAGGYGQIWWLPLKRPTKASRVSWELTHGVRPPGEVRHDCDNPICVNPRHLSIGTHAENMGDAVSRIRMAQGERHYLAKLTIDATYEIESMYESGARLFEIAEHFCVDRMVVKSVIAGRTWKSRWHRDVANAHTKAKAA